MSEYEKGDVVSTLALQPKTVSGKPILMILAVLFFVLALVSASRVLVTAHGVTQTGIVPCKTCGGKCACPKLLGSFTCGCPR